MDEPADAATYGELVHHGISRFLAEDGPDHDAPIRLQAALQRALNEAGLRPALLAWWRPKFARIAAWITAEDARRRAISRPVRIAAEITGEWRLNAPAGPFRLRGRADRIELHEDGRLAILDYKTGQPPSETDVQAGYAPQLTLEAAMAESGAFGAQLAGVPRELAYWHLSGGFVPAKAKILFDGKPDKLSDAVREAHIRLTALMRDFDDPARPYLSCPFPGAMPRFSDYTQLARVAEWSMREAEGS